MGEHGRGHAFAVDGVLVFTHEWTSKSGIGNRFLPFAAPAVSLPEAFSSEVDTGSREENASKQESRASILIQSEQKMLWTSPRSQGGSGTNWLARKSMKARTF